MNKLADWSEIMLIQREQVVADLILEQLRTKPSAALPIDYLETLYQEMDAITAELDERRKVRQERAND